jgi:hypothetical protein
VRFVTVDDVLRLHEAEGGGLAGLDFGLLESAVFVPRPRRAATTPTPAYTSRLRRCCIP